MFSLCLFSCTSEDNLSKDNSANNHKISFQESLQASRANYSEINLLETLDKDFVDGNFTELSLTKVDSNQNMVIKDFDDVALLINEGNLILNEKNKSCIDEDNICLLVDESKIEESFSETIPASKRLLYKYNFTDEEIENELGEYSETGSMILAMIILDIENNNAFSTSVKRDAWSCLGVATGVAGVYDLIQNTSSLTSFGEAATRKQMLRLIGKLGRRFLGWIGVAIFIHDFGDCMNYW